MKNGAATIKTKHALIFTSRVATHSKSPPTYFQIAVVESKLAVAKNLPHGDQAQDLTVRVCVSSRIV